MRQPFRSKYQVTQKFANNPAYYGQFGLKGHEGLDVIPTGTVWDVLCLEDGVVVLDDDVVGSLASDPYGKVVTVWHPAINKATMYCHLQENYVVLGQLVKKGDKIGTMGSTGNSTGAHLHLNLFNTDANGVRQNRDNGFLGGIDPEPWLEETDQTTGNTALDTCLQQHETLVREAVAVDEFRKSISKALFQGSDSFDWQKIFNEVAKLVSESNNLRHQAAVGDKLWDALVTETGEKTVKYEDESLNRLISTLQGLRNTPPEGKVIILQSEYDDLNSKVANKLKDFTGWQLIGEGIKKLWENRQPSKPQ